jgi:hypothetical protein
MSETPSEPPANEAAEERGWELPSWKRIGEFLANVLRLERSIETLKTQNTLLQQDLLRLQRQVDDQAGQLKIISQLMDTTLKERAERSGERAALRLIQTLIELKQDRPTDPS